LPVGAVEFEAGRATANQAEVTDDFIFADARKDKRSAWIEAIR